MKREKISNFYREETLNIIDFNKLDNDKQIEEIEKLLNIMYEDKFKVSRSMVLKVIKLTFAKGDDYLYLANKLTIEKTNNKLTFKFEKRGNKKILIVLLSLSLFAGLVTATYSGLLLLERAKLNIDIDGDGIPDINIDLDDDGIPDINIDLDGDKKPDLNIDYKGNLQAIFALDTNGDGKPDYNLVNDATTPEKLKACKVNCDIDGDGWPDINLDFDGDGIPDMDIDTDEDGIPDLNLDLNGDMICDVMCDTTGDMKCDTNCIETEGYIKRSGPSAVRGEQDSNVDTGYLTIIYEEEESFVVKNLHPEDQPGQANKKAEKTFRIINDSIYTVAYKLAWRDVENTFISENFMYQITSTNNGFNMDDFISAPRDNVEISTFILIPPNSVQEYTVTFKIKGMNEEQNYDQNRVFMGYIKVGD